MAKDARNQQFPMEHVRHVKGSNKIKDMKRFFWTEAQTFVQRNRVTGQAEAIIDGLMHSFDGGHLLFLARNLVSPKIIAGVLDEITEEPPLCAGKTAIKNDTEENNNKNTDELVVRHSNCSMLQRATSNAFNKGELEWSSPFNVMSVHSVVTCPNSPFDWHNEGPNCTVYIGMTSVSLLVTARDRLDSGYIDELHVTLHPGDMLSIKGEWPVRWCIDLSCGLTSKPALNK
jgi:hypothetical protein